MASIATSIQLIDRVSAPINNMISALDSMCSAYESVQDSMNTGFNTAPINSARQAIDAASQDMVELGNHIQDNEDHQENFNNSVNRGASGMDGLVGKALKLAAAYASFQTVEKLMDLSDELTQTTARMSMMNDGLQTTDELVRMVYQSAQDARGSFGDMADVVARFGNNAKDAFGSSEEVVAFANLIQKQMTIAGASTQEASNAMIQLSQGLGSGVLRGEELNSIFEQAPNIIQSIADYLDVPIGQIRAMAQEGQLTADVVKAAIFAASDDINSKFESMPMTWGQVWTTMQNAAIMKMQPVLNKINEIANNEDFQQFASNALSALGLVVVAMLEIMEVAASISSFISENWSIIEPLVLGIAAAMALYTGAMIAGKVAMMASAAATAIHTAMTNSMSMATFIATANQQGLNAALLACPLTWIILLIIALVAIIYAVCAAIAKMTGVANSGFGVICGGINVTIQFFKNLGLSVANIALGIGNAIGALASNMMTAFSNAISSIQSWFYNLLSTAMNVIAGICAALNKLPFVEFDYSGITSAADSYASKAAEAASNKGEYKSIGDAFNSGMSTFDTFSDGWAAEAFTAGASWGDGVADKVSGALDFSSATDAFDTGNIFDSQYSGYDANQMPGNIADTAENTGKAADSLDISSEDLKYLRDIAETETINRFTTAEIKVEAPVTATINNDMDLDGVVDHLTNSVNEAMEKAAEGVHH